MPKLRVLVGISGSGKSTYARQLIKDEPKWIRVNRDDIRRQVCGELTQDYYKRPDLRDLEKQITIVQNMQIKYWLQQDYNVVLDNTNLQRKYIVDIFDFQHLADIEFKIFEIDSWEAKLRVHARENGCNTDYISSQEKDFESIKSYVSGLGIIPKKVIKHEYDDNLPDCILIDIDGTCASHEGIRGPFEWDKVDLDKSIDQVNLILNSIEQLQYDPIRRIYFSGRDEVCREKTLAWLDDNYFPTGDLYMRKAGDQRKDSIVKRELLYDNIIGKYNVLFVIDDRLQVMDMWNSEGIFTVNVNQGLKYF